VINNFVTKVVGIKYVGVGSETARKNKSTMSPFVLYPQTTIAADVGHGILGRLCESMENPSANCIPRHSFAFFATEPVHVYTSDVAAMLASLTGDKSVSIVKDTLERDRQSERTHIYGMGHQWIRTVSLPRHRQALVSLLSDREVREWAEDQLKKHGKCYMIVAYKSSSDGEIVDGVLVQKGYRGEVRLPMKVTPGGLRAVSTDANYEWLGQNFVHDESIFALEFVELWDSKSWTSERMGTGEVGDTKPEGESVTVGGIEVMIREKKISDNDARKLILVKF